MTTKTVVTCATIALFAGDLRYIAVQMALNKREKGYDPLSVWANDDARLSIEKNSWPLLFLVKMVI